MFRNSKKQGDAGLGQAIAYYTAKGAEVALPLTDSTDWDLIIEDEDGLQRVQVKTSVQLETVDQIKHINTMKFSCSVNGGNKTSTSKKLIPEQQWDLLFLYHLVTKQIIIIPKEDITSKGQINVKVDGTGKYGKYII